MEEVDKIILSQLRQIGTDVPDDLESLAGKRAPSTCHYFSLDSMNAL